VTSRVRAAAVADLVTVVCLVIAAWLLLAGAYRQVIGGAAVTVRWSQLLIAAVAIATIRHAVLPRPSLLDSVEDWRVWLARRPALSDALLAFIATRPVVLLIGLLAVAAVGLPPGADEPEVGRMTVPGLASRFDANWYAGIAADGYDWQGRFDRQQNLAFFPAFPLLIRAAGIVTGALDPRLSAEWRLRRLTTCGLMISLAAFLWAAWYFASLAVDVIDDARARGALLLLASYPFAVFFSAAYTESLFLLAALGAWHSSRNERFVSGSLWGLLAGLARPNGFFLSVPLGLIALGARDARSQQDERRRRANPVTLRLAVAAMPAIGMLLFTTYLYFTTGEWFAWARLHAAWGRRFTGELPPLVAQSRSADSLLDLMVAQPYDVLNAMGVAFALAMAWPVWRRLAPAWSIYILINMLPPLFAGGFLSMGRLSSTMFPLFLALGAMLPARTVPAVITSFALLQGLVTVLFYTWRSLY